MMARTSFLIVISFALSTLAGAQVVTYEGDVFPEEAANPWVRDGDPDPDLPMRDIIWNHSGDAWFEQHLELTKGDPGELSQIDVYRRAIDEYIDPGAIAGFFLEGRVQTTVPASVLDFSAVPVALVAFGNGGPLFHLRMTDTLVELTDGNSPPTFDFDIAPETPHTYRFEIFPDRSYDLYIDDVVVHSGTHTSDYPAVNPRIVWGAAYDHAPHVTRWSWVRYGTVPVPYSGDFNSDGVITLADDVFYFDECLRLGGPGTQAGPGCKFADMTGDGSVSWADFAIIQRLVVPPPE